MTGRRRIRSTFLPSRSRRVTRGALSSGAALLCASLAAGCGVIPGSSAAADDSAVTVMTWAPQSTDATNKPGMPAMARAYARWVNDRGGIGGHRLHVLTCNERNDSVGAAKCARRAVDEGAVAVVGSYSQYGDSFLAPLEGAGIPYIGGYGVTSSEFTSPLSYPVNGGQPTLLAGLGKALAPGCGTVALIRPDTIAGDELPDLLNAGLKAGGHAAAVDQRAAEDATEYSGQSGTALKEATSGSAEGCVVPALGDRTSTFMDSFRRVRDGYAKVRTATPLGSIDQTVIDASGGGSGPYEGAYVAGWYPVASDPRWDTMKKVINKEAFGDNTLDPADSGVQTTWIAYTVLSAVLTKIGDGPVTADSVHQTLDDGLSVGTGGLTPTLKWRFAETLSSVGFPRLANPDVTLQVVRGGRLVAAGKGFVDMTGTLESADLS
ncbi:ABC transporter substrate-binding protein [Streptomyces sp. NPDC008150]|uniref:ABC transporter substrate-binding protein n=1 Tax=Streptomyces sp. NPDC008150 TaxID=3364816 RepID=UPI0036E0774A